MTCFFFVLISRPALVFVFFAPQVVLLERAPVSFLDDDANKFRRVVLEILNRLPNNETLRPYTAELMEVANAVLATDNEENALTALRVVFDLHKNYRTAACAGCGRGKADAVVRRSGHCSLCWAASCA